MPTPYWIGYSLILSLVLLLDTGGGHQAGQQAGHQHNIDHREGHQGTNPSLFYKDSSIHKVRVNHHPDSVSNTWTHSSKHSLATSRRQDTLPSSGGNQYYNYHHPMFKRESLFNTTFSDTLHLNVNTNAQTMSHDINDNSMNINNNYFVPDDPPDPYLQLNQTLETMCLRQDIAATCIEEGAAQGAHATNQASIICSSVRPGLRIRRLLYHPLYPSACWSTPPLVDSNTNQCPPPVLNQTIVDAIQGNNSSSCISASRWVLCQIRQVNNDISLINDVMQSGFCVGDGEGDVEGECQEESSSIRCFNCQECKKWYMSWMCMSMWPLWLGPHPIRPCSSVCSLVQEHCPFNIIYHDASTAGGDPTFICQDPLLMNSSLTNTADSDLDSASQPDLSADSPQCCAQPVHLTADSWPGATKTADPPAGGYVDLNATVCLPLLRRETGGSTAYCDIGYNTEASLLRLVNTTLTLRQLRAEPEHNHSNWFWNLVTLKSGCGDTSAPSGHWTRPAILALLLAVIHFHCCQFRNVLLSVGYSSLPS